MSSRRVERLVIRAPDPSLVARGQALIEDALRTASVPGDDSSQVVFIRRLELGVIRSEASPTQVSRAVERELSQVPVRVVGAGAVASSGSAEAVVFDDPIAPGVELARRVAGGGDTGGWLWPLVAPGFEASGSPEEGLRCVLAAALAGETPGLAVARVVSGLAEDGRLGALRGVLRPGEGEGLLQRCGWAEAGWRPARDEEDAVQEGARSVGRERAAAARGPETHATLSALSLLSRAWGAGDARLTWTAAALALAVRPARAALPDLASRSRRWLDEVLRNAPPGSASGSGLGGKDAASPGRGVADEAGRAGSRPRAGKRKLNEPLAGAAGPARAPDARAGAPPQRVAPDEAGPGSDGGGRWSSADGEAETGHATSGRPLQFTAHAGLFFLVPVLDHLGIASALAAEARWVEAELPTRILLAAAERLELPEDDPLREALVTAPLSPAFAAGAAGEPSFEPGQAWRELGLPQVAVRGIDPVVQAWLRAARLWCRGRAAIALHALVRRPGRVAVTPSHLDTCFDLSLVDMRVRRVGLDIDPGFVPWLGRVVLFHYGDPAKD